MLGGTPGEDGVTGGAHHSSWDEPTFTFSLSTRRKGFTGA